MKDNNVEAGQETTVMDEEQTEPDEGNNKNITNNNNISFTNSGTKLSFEQEEDIRKEFALFI